MELERGGIDPNKLGRSVRRKVGLDQEFSPNEAVLPIYRTRWWKMSRKWNGPALMLETLGCNEDCAHCYVPVPLLRADTGSEIFQKRLAELPMALRDFPQDVGVVFDYAVKQFSKRFGTTQGGVIELTGGEPTIYPGGILKLARLCQAKGMTLGLNTDGYLIATVKDFLAQFDGLQDTIKFLVSIKGTTPEEFRRFSGVKAEHYLTPFLAAEKILEHGFDHPFLGVTIDTIATPPSIDADIERLMSLLAQFGLDPTMIIWDKITEQIMGNWFPTRQKMIGRGYYRLENDQLIRGTDPKAVAAVLAESYGVDKSCIK